jgi:hypothetical protein
VRARGKRTQFTSVSLDLTKIRDFGDTDYKLNRELLVRDKHCLVEHGALISNLRAVVRNGEKKNRLRAIQGLRYATRRKEGLIDWSFEIGGVARKDLITSATKKVQAYFSRV